MLGAGSDSGVLVAAFSEVVVALAGIGTAVVLFPVAKRVSETAAVGFATSRVVEGTLMGFRPSSPLLAQPNADVRIPAPRNGDRQSEEPGAAVG